MACIVQKNTLGPSEYEEIKKTVLFYPKTKPISAYDKKKPKPIAMCIDTKTLLILPFLTWSGIFNKIPNEDRKYTKTKIHFTGKLRDNQISVEKESLEQLETMGTSLLGLYPGFGKTVLGAKLASHFPYRVVVLVHREVLTVQWKKTFEDHTNAKVWIVEDNVPIPKEYNVIICMITRVIKMKPKDRLDIGFVIIDEAHAFCTPKYATFLLYFQPQYVLVETATILRDDGMESIIYSISGTHGVYRDSTNPFLVYKVETNLAPKRRMNRQGKVDYPYLTSSILLNQKRDAMILSLVKKEVHNKILILTMLKEHAETLNRLFLENELESDVYCGKKKSYVDKTILTGTVSKIGTGFDPANSCSTYDGRPFNILFLVCSIKKYSLLVQNIGRVFRSNYPTIYHFVDDDPIYQNHWSKASTWYSLHNGVIKNYKKF